MQNKASLLKKTSFSNEIQLNQFHLFYFIVLTLWTLAATVAPVIVICVTKNPLSFSVFSTLASPVYLWLKLAKYIFPMDEKTFELEKMRIQMEIEKHRNAPR